MGASMSPLSIPSEPKSCWEAFTALQGQYLAFIHWYSKLNRRAPAEQDMQRYFGVTPPTVHRMVLELEKRGLISRQPRQPRSIELLVPPELLPPLD
jgi:DNA-binding MarR family transcriptional regulator